MIRVEKSLPLFLVLFLGSTLGQSPDPGVCPQGVTPMPIDANWRFSTDRFEIITELSDGQELMEVSQAFSTARDSIAFNARGNPLLFYWNFETNENFDIIAYVAGGKLERKCVRQEIAAGTLTSIILPGTFFIKPSVLLGFDPRNKKNFNWSIKLVNATIQARGYPALLFNSCFYLAELQATVSVDYYVVNEMLFNIPSLNNQSILLQMDVRVKSGNNPVTTYTYHVNRYIPNPGRFEERQALETPSGVYCAGRSAGLAVPKNIPERVSSNSEAFIPEANASIISTHGLYDTEAGFTRFDVWFVDSSAGPRWQHYREIHDFANGLSYQYNRTTRQCRVSEIVMNSTDATPVPGQPNLIEMGSPQHFFLMDDIQYQYTGQKPCRDRVMCNVWIGEKVLPDGLVQHREWYWAYSIDGTLLEPWIPTKFVWKTYNNLTAVNSYEINIFNFRRNPFTILEIDYTVADCYRALGPKNGYNLGVLSFVIDNDKNLNIVGNLNYLRFHVWETLVFAMFVRPTRISQLIVDQVGKEIRVTFTLLDNPPRRGPVENLFNETSFDALIDRLGTLIDANGLFFRARADGKQVILRARPKSFNVAFRTTETKVTKTSGGRITTFWIVFVLVGIIVGAIGAFAAFTLLARK